MKVLVINCGSSSLKYQVLDMTNEVLECKGLVERIGMDGSEITHEKIGQEKFHLITPMANHKDAIGHVLDAIQDEDHGVVKDMSEIGAVGHRVVHAGEKFAKSVLITDEVIKALEECIPLAPLHNPPNLLGIAACQELMPGTPMVGVFDTAFHQTMPPESFIYAIPYEFYTKHGIRRYGFHGTSHKYVAERAADILNVNLDDLKLITCHLGKGASVSAIKRGKCIDTSMGFTPLEGLVMGTRSGDIDPAIVTYMRQVEHLDTGVGSYILGCLLYEMILGKVFNMSILTNTNLPTLANVTGNGCFADSNFTQITQEQAQIARYAAMCAVREPWTINDGLAERYPYPTS